jgi:hypothetical protein
VCKIRFKQQLLDSVWYFCFSGAVASQRASGKPALLCRTNLRGQCFVTGGDGTSRVWKIIPDKKQAETMDVKFGLIKRTIVSIVVMYPYDTRK